MYIFYLKKLITIRDVNMCKTDFIFFLLPLINTNKHISTSFG